MSASGLTLSPDQVHTVNGAVDSIRAGAPVVAISGQAGTGKTTIAQEIVRGLDLHPARRGALLSALRKGKVERDPATFISCAPTNRAASQLTAKGVLSCTIHSVAYSPWLNSDDETMTRIIKLSKQADRLEVQIENMDEGPERDELCAKWHALNLRAEQLAKPVFDFNPSLLEAIGLLILDEASMIPPWMMRDLTGVEGLQILLLGDSKQLPAIVGHDAPRVDPRSVASVARPDFELTTNHRQGGAGDVFHCCQRLRNGEGLAMGDHGDVKLHSFEGWKDAIKRDPEPFLRGFCISDTNEIRHQVNVALRSSIGLGTWEPVQGERLLIKSNLSKVGIFNNDLIRAGKISFHSGANAFCVESCTLMDTGQHIKEPFLIYATGLARAYGQMHLKARKAGIKASKLPITTCDFGYCVTVHSAQGSERERVTLISSPWMGGTDAETQARFAYTALSRARSEFAGYCSPFPSVPAWQSTNKAA